MSDRPEEPMHDEVGDLWVRYGALLARLTVLEEIAERLAVTCADPIAVGDYFDWKEGGG